MESSKKSEELSARCTTALQKHEDSIGILSTRIKNIEKDVASIPRKTYDESIGLLTKYVRSVEKAMPKGGIL
jgi:hypothetical protein